MPIYDFRCSTCGAVFEKLSPVTHAGTGVACQACELGWAERLPSLPCLPRRSAHAGPPAAGAKPAAAHPPGCGCSLHRPRAARAKSA